MKGFSREKVQGRSIHVGGREIVPEAEIWTFQTKQATIGEGTHASGGGVFWGWAHPSALLERTNGQERRIQIVDYNRRLELALLIAAILLPVALTLTTRLARRLSNLAISSHAFSRRS